MPRPLPTIMKYKSRVSHLNLDAEAVKDLDLDSQARPVRKLESPTIPAVDSAINLSHRKIKGTRKMR